MIIKEIFQNKLIRGQHLKLKNYSIKRKLSKVFELVLEGFSPNCINFRLLFYNNSVIKHLQIIQTPLIILVPVIKL